MLRTPLCLSQQAEDDDSGASAALRITILSSAYYYTPAGKSLSTPCICTTLVVLSDSGAF